MRWKRSVPRPEDRRAEHREHVLHAEDAHLGQTERPRVVDGVGRLELGAQAGDGRRQRGGLLGRDDTVLGNVDEQFLEVRDVAFHLGERMDESDERPRLVDVRLAIRERELLGSRNQLRECP